MLCVIRVLRWGDKEGTAVCEGDKLIQEACVCVSWVWKWKVHSVSVTQHLQSQHATEDDTILSIFSVVIMRWSSDVNIRSCAATPSQLFSLIIFNCHNPSPKSKVKRTWSDSILLLCCCKFSQYTQITKTNWFKLKSNTLIQIKN